MGVEGCALCVGVVVLNCVPADDDTVDDVGTFGNCCRCVVSVI